jgi:hypothetical protein
MTISLSGNRSVGGLGASLSLGNGREEAEGGEGENVNGGKAALGFRFIGILANCWRVIQGLIG